MATRHQYLIIHASEPRRNSNKPLQHIEKLSIARFQQAHSQVRMQWKRRASEPYRKAESGSQPTRNKCVARSSTTTPMVQILATNALQDLQQLHPWFRSLAGLEHHRLQIHSGGASGRGSHQTRNRTAQASEPRQNPRNSPQHIEKLSIARIKQASLLVQMQWERDAASEPEQNSKNPLQRIEKLPIAKFQQESPLVQMQRKMGASEPCCKAESNSQPTHSKRVVRPSAITPVVQIPSGSGMPRNANVPWRHF